MLCFFSLFCFWDSLYSFFQVYNEIFFFHSTVTLLDSQEPIFMLFGLWKSKNLMYMGMEEGRERNELELYRNQAKSWNRDECQAQSIGDLLPTVERKPSSYASRTNNKHRSWWREGEVLLQVEAGLTLDTDFCSSHAIFMPSSPSLRHTNVSLSLYVLSHPSSLPQTRKSFTSVRRHISQND